MEVLRRGVSRLLGRPNSTNVSIASVRCAPPSSAGRRGSTFRRGPARKSHRYRCSPGFRPAWSPRPSSSAKVVGRPLDLDRWTGDRACGCRRGLGGRRLSGGPALSALALATVGCFAGLVVWQGFSMLWTIEADRTWNYVNRALVYLAFLVLGLALGTMRRGAAVCCRMARGRDGGGDRLGARDEDLPRLVGGDRAGRASEQPDRLLERARAADRVRAAAGAVDRSAALAAGLAARGRVVYLYARSSRWCYVLARRCRCRDRGGRALVRDRGGPGWRASLRLRSRSCRRSPCRAGLSRARADEKTGSLARCRCTTAAGSRSPSCSGGSARFAAAFFVARYENQRPLTEPWRLRLGRAAVVAVVAAAAVSVGALLAAGSLHPGCCTSQRAGAGVSRAGGEQPDEPLLEQPLELVAGGVEGVARAPGARHRRWNVRPHAPKAARGRHRRDGARTTCRFSS